MLAVGLIVALAIGISLGLFGAGGSILTVPAFHYVFGLDAHAAVTSSLLVVATTSVSALLPQAHRRCVRWRTGGLLGIVSMAASYVGGRASANIPARALLVAFALIMLAAGLALALQRQRPMASTPPTAMAVRLPAIGIGVGVLTGVLGAGGGFLLVPALVIAGRLPVREAVGTSLLVVVLNTLIAFAAASSHAAPRLDLVGPVAGLALAGSLVGTRLGRRLSVAQLQRGFGAFVVAIGVVILTRELAISLP